VRFGSVEIIVVELVFVRLGMVVLIAEIVAEVVVKIVSKVTALADFFREIVGVVDCRFRFVWGRVQDLVFLEAIILEVVLIIEIVILERVFFLVLGVVFVVLGVVFVVLVGVVIFHLDAVLIVLEELVER